MLNRFFGTKPETIKILNELLAQNDEEFSSSLIQLKHSELKDVLKSINDVQLPSIKKHMESVVDEINNMRIVKTDVKNIQQELLAIATGKDPQELAVCFKHDPIKMLTQESDEKLLAGIRHIAAGYKQLFDLKERCEKFIVPELEMELIDPEEIPENRSSFSFCF